MAPTTGSNIQFNFSLIEIELRGAMITIKYLFAICLLIAHLLGKISIFNYYHTPLIRTDLIDELLHDLCMSARVN